MTAASRDLELLVAKIQQQLAPNSEVIHDTKLPGRNSMTDRQIDVLVRDRVGQYEILIVIDAKGYARPVDVKGVEEFDGLLRDVGAHRGVLVCPMGFTEAAKARAKGLQIDLYSPVDTDVHKWQAIVTLPAICDFRSAQMAFRIQMMLPIPLVVQPDFYAHTKVYDERGNDLGTALDAALKQWNDGHFPIDPGTHRGLVIFPGQTLIDNERGGPTSGDHLSN